MTSEDLLFMPGTSQHAKYLVIARRGRIALGIRPYPIAPGSRMGVVGKTFVPVRVHSREWIEGLPQYDLNEQDNVVPIQHPELTLDGAWPGITFESVHEDRAATTASLFVEGSIDTEPTKVLARLESGEVFDKLATFLDQVAGHEHMIIRIKPLAAWLASKYAGPLAKLGQIVETQKTFASEVDASLEVPGFQAAKLQALYEQHAGALVQDFVPGEDEGEGIVADDGTS